MSEIYTKQELEFFAKVSQKLSMSLEETKKEYERLLSQEKEIHLQLTEEQQKGRAISRMNMMVKRHMMSPAVVFEGMVIDAGDVVDAVARKRVDALNMFERDREEAIRLGVTNEEGVPLDNIKVYSTGRANPNYHKPLPEHSYIRNIVGVAGQKGTNDSAKIFTMTINGDDAQNPIPIFQPVRFKAVLKDNKDKYTLNHSKYTKFEIAKELSMPSPEIILKKYFKGNFVKLGDLEMWFEQNKDDFNRMVITEGDVVNINLNVNSQSKNKRLLLDDISRSMDTDEDWNTNKNSGVVCWIPEAVPIDFAEESRIIVVGKPNRGKKRMQDGTYSDEPGNININVHGIYCLPQYKVNVEVKEIKAEDLNLDSDGHTGF